MQELYGGALRQSPVFVPNDEAGEKRWQELHKRVIEHVSYMCLSHHVLKLRLLTQFYAEYSRCSQILHSYSNQTISTVARS